MTCDRAALLSVNFDLFSLFVFSRRCRVISATLTTGCPGGMFQNCRFGGQFWHLIFNLDIGIDIGFGFGDIDRFII